MVWDITDIVTGVNPINRLNEYIYYHNRLNRRIVRFKRSWDEIYKIINGC